MTERRQLQPDLGIMAQTERYVKTKQELEHLLFYLRDTRVRADLEAFERKTARYGDNGVLLVYACHKVPYQQMWIHYMDIIDLLQFEDECPDLLQACMDEHARIMYEQMEIVSRCVRSYPVDAVEFPDNLVSSMVGPERYDRYCLPFYRRMLDILAGTGVPLGTHSDGNLRGIYDNIAKTGFGFLESFSPPPDNDTPVAEALRMWPDMRLFVNFPSSVHLCDEETIAETARDILCQLDGRGWIQVSESLPPNRWKEAFPVLIKAIEGFRR